MKKTYHFFLAHSRILIDVVALKEFVAVDAQCSDSYSSSTRTMVELLCELYKEENEENKINTQDE
jgi:hypothetical protein